MEETEGAKRLGLHDGAGGTAHALLQEPALNEEEMKLLIVLAFVAIGMTSTLALAQHAGAIAQSSADGGHMRMSPQGMTMKKDGGM